MRITRAPTVRRLKVRAVILAIVVATVARAQAPIATPIRLGEIYAQVQHANPKLAAARALVRAARARTPAASRLPDPQLQLGFMNYSLPSLEPDAAARDDPAPAHADGPARRETRRWPADRRRAGRCDKRARRRSSSGTLRSQTAAAFYDLYATDRQLGVARETVTLLQAIAHTAESMYRVGEGRQADVLRAQVEIAKMVEDTLRIGGRAPDHGVTPERVARIAARHERDCRRASACVPRLDAGPRHGSTRSRSNGRPMIRAGLEGRAGRRRHRPLSRGKRSSPTSRSACSMASAMRRPPRPAAYRRARPSAWGV